MTWWRLKDGGLERGGDAPSKLPDECRGRNRQRSRWPIIHPRCIGIRVDELNHPQWRTGVRQQSLSHQRATVGVDGRPSAEASTDQLTTSEVASSSNIGSTQTGGSVPSHNAIASGSGSWGQQVTIAEATLLVMATSTSLGSLLRCRRRRRRGSLVPPIATCAALAQGACEEDREPPPSALTPSPASPRPAWATCSP
jgi:hypothetical protein